MALSKVGLPEPRTKVDRLCRMRPEEVYAARVVGASHRMIPIAGLPFQHKGLDEQGRVAAFEKQQHSCIQQSCRLSDIVIEKLPKRIHR